MHEPDYRLTWVLPDGARVEGPAWGKLNLLAHADTHDLELPQACGGHAECGTCRVRVVAGEMTPVRHEEAELVQRHAKRFRDRERLACQARPRSDSVVEILAIAPPDLRDVAPGE